MIKCPICKKQISKGQVTGKFNTMVYVDSLDREKGKRIYSSKTVCMDCKGECLLK